MEDSHLTNTVLMLMRKAGQLKLRDELRLISGLSHVNGDGATDALESEIAHMGRMTDHEYAMALTEAPWGESYRALTAEADRRAAAMGFTPKPATGFGFD